MLAFKKFAPLALAAAAAAFSAIAPDLVAAYPEAAGTIAAIGILLASFAPSPASKAK